MPIANKAVGVAARAIISKKEKIIKGILILKITKIKPIKAC